MGRTKRSIDKQQLVNLLNELESKGSFENRSELYRAVAETEWAKELKLSPSVVYLRVQEFKIPLKTPIGKKGNPNLGKMNGNKKPKERNIPPKVKKQLTNTLKRYGYEHLAPKILGGSMANAIKAKCIDCCNGEKSQIRDCEIFDCALWIYRPYAPNSKVDSEEVDCAS